MPSININILKHMHHIVSLACHVSNVTVLTLCIRITQYGVVEELEANREWFMSTYSHNSGSLVIKMY